MFAFVVCATTSFPNSGWRRVLTIHQVQEKKIKCTLKMILTIQWYVYVIHQVRVKNGGAWDPAGFLVPATFCCWSSSNPSHIVFLSHANKQSRQFILMLCIHPPFSPKLFKRLLISRKYLCPVCFFLLKVPFIQKFFIITIISTINTTSVTIIMMITMIITKITKMIKITITPTSGADWLVIPRLQRQLLPPAPSTLLLESSF